MKHKFLKIIVLVTGIASSVAIASGIRKAIFHKKQHTNTTEYPEEDDLWDEIVDTDLDVEDL